MDNGYVKAATEEKDMSLEEYEAAVEQHIRAGVRVGALVGYITGVVSGFVLGLWLCA